MSETRTVFSVLDDITAHIVLVVGLSFAAAVTTSVIVLIMPAAYTSSGSFVPEETADTRLPSNLAGLASQFGLSVGGQPSRSPAFYADLLRSREVLATVLSARIPDPDDSADSVGVYAL